jgi:hypothetical protein
MGDIGSAVATVQRIRAARLALHTFAARFNGVLFHDNFRQQIGQIDQCIDDLKSLLGSI